MNDPIVMTMKAAVEPTSRPYDELLELARQKAPDPSVFDNRSAAFWRAQASNNTIDFYGTSMAKSTLQNYVADLNAGISYQDSHDWGRLGLGQSILGEMIEKDELIPDVDQPLREVHGTFMTLEGVTVGAYSTDTFLDMIRSGTWRDVSIGFYARDITCSICGKQSFHWWEEDGCLHLPGVEYEVGDEKKPETKLAWASVNDGRLLETSQVYDGATSGAGVNQVVMKADALSEERRITERERRVIERRYQVRLKEPRLVVPGWTRGVSGMERDTEQREDVVVTPVADDQAVVDGVVVGDGDQDIHSGEPVVGAGGVAGDAGDAGDAVVVGDSGEDGLSGPVVDDEVEDETVIELPEPEPVVVDGNDVVDAAEQAAVGGGAAQETTVDDVLAGERVRLEGTGIRLGKDPVKAVGALADALLDANRRNAELVRDAELGRRYREKVIEETLAEGVRARSNAFRREAYQELLADLSIDKIELIRDDLKAEADRNLVRTVPVNRSDEMAGREHTERRRKSGAHRVG